MNFRAGLVAILAVLVMPTYCKLLLVEIEDDGRGDAAAYGSPGAVKMKKTMKGAVYLL